MRQNTTPKDAPKYLKNVIRRSGGGIDQYAYTRINGQRIALGRYGDPEGYARWQRLRLTDSLRLRGP